LSAVTKKRRVPDDLLGDCLAEYISAGTLDLSLDQLAAKVGVSKRMLIHYFISRENLEIAAIGLLEDRLRAQFNPASFPAGTSPQEFVAAMWSRSMEPQARGVLRLIMDVTRRGWSGSERAKVFYEEQQRMWQELLQPYFPDRAAADELVLLFQGAVLAYLVTGDAEQGRHALLRRVQCT
jgi:AcrR family transcriptional regulator